MVVVMFNENSKWLALLAYSCLVGLHHCMTTHVQISQNMAHMINY